MDIQVSFETQIDRLRRLGYDVLDVRVSRWHDDYHVFKNAVKELEVMFTNIINSSFENNSTISEGVVLIDTFHQLSKRETVKRCVERKASELRLNFLKEIQSLRAEFEQRRSHPPVRPQEPKFAGSALWAHSLSAIIEKDYEMLKKLNSLMTPRDAEEAKDAFLAFAAAIKEFKQSRYQQWIDVINEQAKDNGLQARLDKHLLRRVEAEPGHSHSKTASVEIVCNFDEELLAMFNEVVYWDKFQAFAQSFTIPYIAHDICTKRESLRVMREQVMLLVRAYNDIIRDINSEERRLFVDHMRKLDKRIGQGMSKLTWQSKNMIEMYVKDCCSNCAEVHTIVKEFKECKATISKACKTVSTALLLKVDKNMIYEEGLFEARQKEHRTLVVNSYEAAYQRVISTLRNIYKNFKEGSAEVQREWKSQITQIDKAVEQSLKSAVKRSLQELSKAINGDSKTDPQQLFTVRIILEGVHPSQRVTYCPSMDNLTRSVNIVAKDIIGVVASVPRIKGHQFDAAVTSSVDVAGSGSGSGSGSVSAVIPDTGATGENKAPEDDRTGGAGGVQSYYDIISDDSDILRVITQVMNGMASTATELQKYLLYWDKYKSLWDTEKEAYIKKYAKHAKSPSQFDTDISRYRSQQQEVQGEASSHTINFVRVDCNTLKDGLVGHCLQFQNKLASLLNQNGAKELAEIFQLFRDSEANLRVLPTNLDELSQKLLKCKELKENFQATRGRFDPVREIYETLTKFEVIVKDDELQMLGNLDTSFEDFKVMLSESERQLDKSKVTMKRDLESQMESYGAQMVEMRAAAQIELPYSSDKKPEQALVIIEAYNQKIAKARERESSLAVGLAIFGIKPEEHKDLQSTVRDIDFLTQIWQITIEWQGNWDKWKLGQFNDLNVDEMETVAGNVNKKVGKLGKDIKRWRVWEAMKSELDKFRETIPLIQGLRDQALRARHWAALQERVGAEFDHNSPQFTLDEVMRLGLNAHAEFIGELSGNANKELAIETALSDLAIRWQDIQVDVGAYKDKYYKLKSTDDISQFLEDDSVALSTMKASKFYGAFSSRIDEWEHILSVISEVIESLLAVQRKWIYLESIFMSGGDIAKQLPGEYTLFIGVNTDFFKIMEQFFKFPNAKRTCLEPGLVAVINKMDAGLEKIQKSLDQYLETKRMVFPRFYFVSDDDLLEILGQSKDPVAVQKHIKKCFEGIKSLKLIPPGKMTPPVEATMMNSPDGEVAPFADNVIIDGPVELWLVQVEKAMRRAIAKLLSQAIQGFKGNKKEKWVKETIGQLLITTGSIAWTQDCTKALNAISSGSKGALKSQKKKQVSYLNKLTAIIRGQLSRVERDKVVALITMEIHNRDVMERMVKANCSAVSDFEWLSQLRFIYIREAGEFGKCEVRQTNSVLEYSYEYQGNNGRLVVTPLTDRCVLTLITAMYLNRGGNPLGPAGTGKTETVKDLGKNLAKYVVVINCSDGMDYKSVGRVFSGLVQSGSWGCFDEFNRIKIEVISVVAMQILSILNALSAKVPSFSFMGMNIPCNPNCGVFITMNPGYAGRTELPDNLKALMRPVAMMAPDLTMIAEVMLASEGFNEARIMAKKTVTLYSLMIQQLSKQDHYDYGLRNLKAVLNMAGQLKRGDPNMPEEAILMRALRDMNLPKFIKDDERLFRLLLGDLFPSLELPVSEYGTLQTAIEAELDKMGLQKVPFQIGKIFQFYDSRLTRHCNMLVGDPMGGKSTAWKMLASAQTTLCKSGVEGFQSVTPYVINPKSIELDELYGAYDLATFEWKDGILSTIFKQCSEDEKPAEKWILFDGPIDAMWIESMNSVMDDNKILTLINGDRIPLTGSMSLVFETQDLRVASPATVSRAGMIYLDASELGWQCYTETWVTKNFADEETRQLMKDLFEKWIPKTLKFKETNCNEPVKIADFSAVVSLCALYNSLEKAETSFSKDKLGADFNSIAEKMFLFSLIWSVGGAVDEQGRKKISTCLGDVDSIFPPAGTIYDYYVDISKNEFLPWEGKVPNWRPLKTMTFHDMIVPTIDTVRNYYVTDILMKIKRNVILVGNTGTGKTVLAQSVLKDLPDSHSQLVINFSAATTSAAVQDIIEGPMEKRSKDKLGPLGGKNLIIFIDDFNMPKKTSFESPFQPPLELIRLWMDYQGWYDRLKCGWKFILDSQLLCSMGHPGGGRNQICGRTQSRFSLINFTFPSDSQIVRIFDSILSSKFADYDNEIKQLSSGIALATLNVYKAVSTDFLATPEKFHYLFNIRDVAKVMQGILMAGRATVHTPETMLRLWVHECQRVFADRFVRTKTNDEQKFYDILYAKMNENIQKDMGSVMGDALEPKVGPMFCAFLTDGGDEGVVYEEVSDYKKVRAVVEEKLEDYNMEPKLISMDLAMFRDAIMHVSRIHRVIVQPRGNIMLVGVGGSGRSSLTRLSAYIAGMTTFSIEITKNYRLFEFREDIKKLYLSAGCDNKPTVFLFNDTQIKDEGFLEDVNNILSSGVVPNLFLKDEVPGILDSVRKPAMQAGVDETTEALWAFFIDRVRANLHVVLAVSPIGESLRNRCRMYPGLVNCTTIDWFHTWPAEALQEVAMKFLSEVHFEKDEYRAQISAVFADMHLSVIGASDKMLNELKRYNYVTPTNYLELVKGYRVLLAEKSTELGNAANKLANGLAKLEDAKASVRALYTCSHPKHTSLTHINPFLTLPLSSIF